jgi:hypothetical protein
MQRLRTRLRSGASSGFAPPSLLLDFTSGAGFDSRITFTRGSNATLVDSTGKITYAPANLLLQSQTFDNASWTKTAATVTPNATTAPDGTLTADKLVEDTSTSQHRTDQTPTSPAGAQTFSVFAKAAERAFMGLRIGSIGCGFNLSDGTTYALSAGVTATIVSAGDGWYRCSISVSSAAANDICRINLSQTAGTLAPSYTGNGTSGIFIWGAQLEPVTYQTTPSTYVATTTAAYYGPRFDYDPVTLAPKGILIEEQRVNLVTYSEQFNNAAWSKSSVTVTADTTVAPDGTTTADTLTASTAAAFTWQVISFTGDGDKTMSCFVKAGTAATSVVQIRDATAVANRGYFIITWTAGVPSVAPLTTGTVLGVDAFGNGWYRLRLLATGVVAANSNQYRFLPDTTSGTGTVIAWGAQAENGSFATSYIPTVASQVTRSADVATMTGTNFSSWYNAAEGSFVFEGSTQLGATRHFLNGQTSNDRFLSSSAAGSTGISDLTNSAVGGIITANTTFKAAVSYGLGGLAASLNGGTAGTSAYSGVFASVNELQIGRRGALYIIGHIRSIAYYNTQLPNAQLQALTAPQMITTLSLDFINGIYDA